MKMSRRNFITNSMLTTAGVYAGVHSSEANNEIIKPGFSFLHSAEKDNAFKISVFSKHLQWLDYDGMASTAASLGFEAIDLTVRPDGHVLPERVADDLPKAYEAVKKAGLDIYSIVTAINNAADPLTEKILKTASALGISYYRTGYFHYDEKKSIDVNLTEITAHLKKIEALNKKYNIQGLYQNHSGHYFGAAIWDLAQALKNIDAKYTGSQYDIYHATIEGANSWIYGFQRLQPFVKMIIVKDFQWTKKDGKWISDTVPLGEGMVDFKNYFARLKASSIKAPVSLHFEYPIAGAEHGARTLTADKQVVLDAMRKDLSVLKRSLSECGLTPG